MRRLLLPVSWFRLVFTLILGLILGPAVGQAGDMALHPTVMRELNLTIRSADLLHQALIKQDEEQLEIGIRDVIHQIDRVRTVAILAKQHERHHLLRILEAGREYLESAQTAFGDERKTTLQQAYNQMVNLVRIYKIDKLYGIFFCDKDKGSWVQKGHKAQNPFTTTARHCGVRVPR